METKALRRLEDCVEKLVERLNKAAERQSQLSAALVKSREERDALNVELQRFRAERVDTRKKVDKLLKRFAALEMDWEQAES